MPAATQIKRGNTIILDGQLFSVLSLTHITPGKGNAIVHVNLRNVKTGVKTEKRFRSNENVETADILTRTMQYLYESDGVYHFMDTENYEQYELSKDVLGESLHLLIAQSTYTIDLHENSPVGITFPSRLTFRIVQTDPPQKGDAGKVKSATLNSGLVIKVPLFLAEGEAVVIDTESLSYVERA